MIGNEEVESALEVIMEDVEAQILFLEGNGEEPWDTKNSDNWDAIYTHLEIIKTYLDQRID